MSQKGLFSLAVILAMAVVLLLALGFRLHASSLLGHSKALALQAEKAAFVRSELEYNADRVIQGTLDEQLRAGVQDASVIEARLTENFLVFLQEAEARHPSLPSVDFFSGVDPVDPVGPVDYAFLRSRFKVVVTVVNGIAFARFHNAARDFTDSVNARISFPDHTQSFVLPPNYVADALQVGACVP